MKPDHELGPDELDDKYNPDGDGEHPEFTQEHWRQAVARRETFSGYWNWVCAQLHANHLRDYQ